MNKIKSLYMMLLPVTLIVIIGFSIYQLFKSSFDWSWVAVIITTLPLLVFLMVVMIFQSQARTHPFLPIHTGVVIFGLVCAIVLSVFPSIQNRVDSSHLALVFAELGFVLHVAYLFWYSSLKRPEQQIIKIDSQLPSFVVYKNNMKVLSESFLGFSTIIIFYRGNWCPFCMAQIKELAQQYRELVLSGIKIVLISPQPEKITEALAKRFNVPFIFLTDTNNQAANQLALNHKHGLPTGLELQGYSSDTVYPTVIVTNRQGNVVYLDETPSFRNRPEPKEYLNILMSQNIS